MTQSAAHLDPELAGPLQGFLDAIGGGFDLGDIPATRHMVTGLIAAVNAQAPRIEGIETRDITAPAEDGGASVPVRVYRPASRSEALPVLLWMHGGGWVLGDLELDHLLAAQLAKDVDCAVVSVDYRLAPEHPFPTGLSDCYAALKWLSAESAALRIDPARIAVGGASAGGNLAAALALLARDRGDVRVAFQLLIYAALDDRTSGPTSESRPETLFWSRQNAIDAWTAYLGGAPGGENVSPYAAPARAESLRGLPPAYLAVGALDPFLGENMSYARRLLEAGVATQLHVYPGAFHAFDVFAAPGRVAQQFTADRNAVLRRVLYPLPTPAA
jgi:acetyl esterase/lipase